jgi:hypothetical protein
MGDYNDNLLTGSVAERRVSIIRKQENAGLIGNKFKKVCNLCRLRSVRPELFW